VLGIGTSYLILFLPSEILGNYLYKYMKIHHVLKLAGIAQVIGALIRLVFLFNPNFTWIFIGNLIIAATNAII